MNPVRNLRQRTGLTQARLAAGAGTSQPTISAYESGRKSPTLATLDRLASAAGLVMTVAFHQPLTREERRSLHLHAAIARKLADDPVLVRARARRNLATMRERNPHAHHLLDAWATHLQRSTGDLISVLFDPSPWARELRHVTPFGGVLSAAERARVYGSFERTSGAV
jgi:transcriptional regulator with XRE-family HTH domain